MQEVASACGLPPSDAWRADRNFMLRALHKHPEAWRLLKSSPPALRSDPAVIRAALRGPGREAWRAVLYATPELVAGLALEALRASRGAAYDCYRALLAAAPELRNDRALLQEATKMGGVAALEHAGAGLRRDKDLLSEALEISARACTPRGPQSSAGPNWGQLIKEAGGLAGLRRGGPAPEVVGERRRSSLPPRPDCASFEAEDGSVVHAVPRLALRLQRPDGCLLAEVRERTAECVLPGCAMTPQQLPGEALGSFIRDRFPPMERSITRGLGRPKFVLEEETRDDAGGAGAAPGKLLVLFGATLADNASWSRLLQKVPVDEGRLRERGATSARSLSRGYVGLGQRFRGSRLEQMPPDVYTVPQAEPAMPSEAGEERGCGRPDAPELVLYTWVPEWEFDWFQEEPGRGALRAWLADLRLPGRGPRRSRPASASAAASALPPWPRSARARASSPGPCAAAAPRPPRPAPDAGGRRSRPSSARCPGALQQ